MRILVTGGAGFIGSHVTPRLLSAGHEVTVLDNLSNGHEEAVPEGARLIRGDLREETELETWLSGKEAVIHLAAFVPVPTSVEKPVEFTENNVLNTVRLLEAMRRSEVRRIIFSSSATVYGKPQSLPLLEDHPLAVPSNPYGASKIAAEGFINVYNRLHDFDATVLRYFNPYGPGELCQPETHLIPNAIKAALGGRPIPVYWGGEQIRDFIFVDDLARAHVAVLPLSGLNVLNVGADEGVRVQDLLDLLAETMGEEIAVEDRGERAGDVPAIYASSRRIREATGWAPHIGLREGLARTVEYFRHLEEDGR